jgi:hypothetical protein
VTDLARRVLMRSIIEDREIDHDQEIGSEWSFAEVNEVTDSVVGRVFRREAEDTTNPIAATTVVRKPLELTLDEDAFRQATS